MYCAIASQSGRVHCGEAISMMGVLWYVVVSSLETYGYFVVEWFVGSNVIVVQVSTRSRARGLEG